MDIQGSFVEGQRPPLRYGRSRREVAALLLACAVLILSVIACNFAGTAAPEQPITSVVTLPPAWTPTVVGAAPFTATAGSAPATAQLTPIPGVGPALLPENVCDLIPAERVQTVLGEAVAQTGPAENTCTHVLASGTSLTATVLRGDAARGVFVDLIAQLSAQEGCTLSSSFNSSATAEPTPLPAEVEALVAGKSLLELARMYVDLDAAQCDPPLELVSGLGDLAFYYPLDLVIVETVSLGILTGDAYVTFTLAIGDPQADPETAVLQLPQAQERLKSLAQPVLAPVP